MTLLEGILLGIVQGLTEFIPVSSSGHLVIAEHFLHISSVPVFSALVNLGTFLALLIFFRKRIMGILQRMLEQKDYRLARNILISAVPVGILGFFFGEVFEQAIIQNPITVVIMLVLFGVVMIALESLPRLQPIATADNLTTKKAGVIGFAQALALIPGTSRSASTMIAGRFMGLTYQQAAEYSFLLSIPVMAGVLLKSMTSQEGMAFIQNNFATWLASNVAAFACGLLAVGFMMRFLAKGNFKVFGYYRIGLAAIIIILLITL
ncbi:MAG: undecaprenyl-diphosphate phosphatase [Candidatus Saccharimonadales bacterium]